MTTQVVKPNPDDPRLTEHVAGIDEQGGRVKASVVVERPLTLFLNDQEIVTMMTVGDYPEYLAVGYLANQNMLLPDDEIVEVVYDDDLEVVVVRTARQTDYEAKLKKKTLTSGCAQGTVFGDLMETFEGVKLNGDAVIKTSWLYADEGNQYDAEPLSCRRRDPWLRIVRARPAPAIYGRCRPSQRGR